MILRRITEHVKAQNWFAVGLDFFIVVVGVFIGIQVSNWNNARADRVLEREYLERLYADMNGSLEDYKGNDNWDQMRIETQAVVLKALRDGTLAQEDRNDFASGLTYLGRHNPIRRRWGTVEELKTTGNIAILQDVSLRTKIAAIDADYERTNQIIGYSAAQITGLRTIAMQNFEPIEFGFETEAAAMVEYDFEAMVADRKFANIIANIQLQSQVIVSFTEDHMQKISSLRDDLSNILEIEPEETDR